MDEIPAATPRIAIQPWQGPLLMGRAAGVASVRSTVNVARLVRKHRPVRWRVTCARLLAEAAQARAYLATGRVGTALLDEIRQQQTVRDHR